MLSEEDYAAADRNLQATDELLASQFPGDSGSRQPVHTVYIPGDQYRVGFAREYGEQSLAFVDQAGGIEKIAETLLPGNPEASLIAQRVQTKLSDEPIEDLRIDFEDGFGDRGDEAEDAAVIAAATQVAQDAAQGSAPPFIGIRFKCFEAPTRRRGIRTLDLFVSTLAEHGPLPEGLILTLPKVTTVDQVREMVRLTGRLEETLGLAHGRLGFEVQIETPQVILGPDGTAPVASLLHAGEGRITGLHYGTFDYSASVGVAAAYQSLEHPAADHAKAVMQVAAAGTGVRLSDGSTNIVPTGGAESLHATWSLHSGLVRRSLERAYYQGWDMHPSHLVSRYLTTFAFFREGVESVGTRLRAYNSGSSEDGFMDEPATAKALAGFMLRGVNAGAISVDELHELVGITPGELKELTTPTRR